MRLPCYAALYDVTPDWYPFVGPRVGLVGYADANGGSGHGFKLGPAIGRSLARWLVEGEVEEDFKRLSHDRLASGRSFAQGYGGNRG
jgi:sarcosine oxidase subunit beta